mgnify:CR=1 FL=1
MYIRKKWLSILNKLALALSAIVGLAIQFGVLEGSLDLSLLNYFTILSNLVCVFTTGSQAVLLMRGDDPDKIPLLSYTLKGVSMMNLTVTMLVAHFLLKDTFTMSGIKNFSVDLLHYVVPILALVDWLLYDPKGMIRGTSPLLWAVAPLLYFVYAIIAAQIGDGIGYGSRYPYPFMDADLLGWGQVLINVAGLTVAFIALGYVFLGVDRILTHRRMIHQVQ